MKTIEQFIDDFRTRQNDYIPTDNNDAEEVIRHQFRAGYCYYFAHMLELAYPGGEVCLCYPFGHWIYKYNNIPYDIEGMYSNEDVQCFLPESYIPKEYITDFLHNGTDYNTSKEEIEALQTVMQSAVKSGQ